MHISSVFPIFCLAIGIVPSFSLPGPGRQPGDHKDQIEELERLRRQNADLMLLQGSPQWGHVIHNQLEENLDKQGKQINKLYPNHERPYGNELNKVLKTKTSTATARGPKQPSRPARFWKAITNWRPKRT
ncbi:hypothetical protein F5148DRAFT_552624 [Russula earlei]|uniref:Uncharacterized protein n=1 Tax=Russula earlei TaxID=71964 RepID=A0ACC0TW23_9AGAM|nr:hypothetical protein F5148DRAFT_552624 [Russula earlei]